MHDNKRDNAEVEGQGGNPVNSTNRRELVRRLAKAGTVLPVAAVIYNASSTVAHAS
jgi:hypothetical protein